MQVVVLGCKDCVLYNDEYSSCGHPLHEKDGSWSGECINGTPDWCPLNKEPLIITKPSNTLTYTTNNTQDNEQWRYM